MVVVEVAVVVTVIVVNVGSVMVFGKVIDVGAITVVVNSVVAIAGSAVVVF